MDIDKVKLGEYLNSRWYPGTLVRFEGEVKDEDGFYHVLLDGAKTPHRCITAGFELDKSHLERAVMIVFKKALDRWVIVSLNDNRPIQTCAPNLAPRLDMGEESVDEYCPKCSEKMLLNYGDDDVQASAYHVCEDCPTEGEQEQS